MPPFEEDELLPSVPLCWLWEDWLSLPWLPLLLLIVGKPGEPGIPGELPGILDEELVLLGELLLEDELLLDEVLLLDEALLLDEELLDEELCELCDELELLLEGELGLLGGALLLEEDEDELGILGDDELELEVL